MCKKCIDPIVSGCKKDFSISNSISESIEDSVIEFFLLDRRTQSRDESEKDILRCVIRSMTRLDERGHEWRKIVTRDRFSHSRERDRSGRLQEIFDQALMDRDPRRDRRIPRLLDEGIRFFERVMEVRIIVHISETIIPRDERESWRWEFLVGVEIPVIVVDVIHTIVEDIPFVEGEGDDTARKSPIRTDLIAILIEDDIAFWLVVTEHRENILFMRLIEIQDRSEFLQCIGDMKHFILAIRIDRTNTSKCLTCIIEGLTEFCNRSMIPFEPIRRRIDPQRSEESNISGWSTITDRIRILGRTH